MTSSRCSTADNGIVDRAPDLDQRSTVSRIKQDDVKLAGELPRPCNEQIIATIGRVEVKEALSIGKKRISDGIHTTTIGKDACGRLRTMQINRNTSIPHGDNARSRRE